MQAGSRRIDAPCLLTLALSLAAACGAPTPLAPTQAPASKQLELAQDAGPSEASQTLTTSIVLKVRNPDALEAYVRATQDPGSHFYHRFLSVREFVALFAPGDGEIRQITRYLAAFGIQVTEVYADHLVLKATGTADAFNRAFSTELHDYTRGGRRFHRPHRPPTIPLLLRDTLLVVAGVSNEALFRPRHRQAVQVEAGRRAAPRAVLPGGSSTATGVPQSYTVGDVANLYNINPLYKDHVLGKGRTLGIATLANFLPSDAYTYWSLIGLDVLPGRITQVHVDGGGELSAEAGSGETALDVEQSGGIAPRAKMVVYDAPNSDAGFIDVFYKAASDNIVDSLSVSWGESEEFFFLGDLTGVDTTQMVAYHQAFLELAAQGVSVFAASGDDGAYDWNGQVSGFAPVLSVDSPANDPALTASGGTTVPVTLSLGIPGAPDLVVPKEQVWGWDYLQDYLVKYAGPEYEGALFSVGGGGGVSVYWRRPWYQGDTQGVRTSERGQRLTELTDTGPVDLLDLPARFAGRNLPDVSLNADPETGYLVYSTPDGGLQAGFGGTSFVAPQLSGISVLLQQIAGGRIGLWNPMLYRFQRLYGHGPLSPFKDITAGDNWFYRGVPGYEPGAGVGVLNVANLARAVEREGDSHH